MKELLTTKINCSQILFDFLISCLIQGIFGSSTSRSLFYTWMYIIGISWCLCYNRKALGAENRIMWANTVLANTLMSGLDMHKGFGAGFRWIILSCFCFLYHKTYKIHWHTQNWCLRTSFNFNKSLHQYPLGSVVGGSFPSNALDNAHNKLFFLLLIGVPWANGRFEPLCFWIRFFLDKGKHGCGVHSWQACLSHHHIVVWIFFRQYLSNSTRISPNSAV